MSIKLRDTTRGGGEGISSDQLKAIIALLEHPTMEKAAKAAGTHKNTIYKWLKEDEQFRDAYYEARIEAYSLHVARLQSATSIAVDALVEIAEDKNQQGATRVGAAKTILDNASKAIEKEDFISRMRSMEQALEQALGQGANE